MINRISFLSFFSLLTLFNALSAQTFTEILGRPTDRSVTISALFSEVVQVYFEFGTAPGNYAQSTPAVTSIPNTPVVLDFQPLLPNTRYYYRTVYKKKHRARLQLWPRAYFPHPTRSGVEVHLHHRGRRASL